MGSGSVGEDSGGVGEDSVTSGGDMEGERVRRDEMGVLRRKVEKRVREREGEVKRRGSL